MTIAAVVTAAGSGTRLGADVPKALISIHGRALVAWAVAEVSRVADAVVVTAPSAHLDAFREALAGMDVQVVAGGETRQQSVDAGLAALELADDDIVLIHDAARAFQPAEVMRAAIAALTPPAPAPAPPVDTRHDASAPVSALLDTRVDGLVVDGAVPVVSVVDTLIGRPGDDGTLGAPVDRADFRAVQTPQVFRAGAILDAHRHGRADATDDATLARERGYRVVAVDGHEWGFKVTRPSDMPLALYVAAQMEES